MFKFRNELKYFKTHSEAYNYLRQMVTKDCNNIGITEMNIINQVIASGNHRYMIVGHDIFDDVGGLIENQGYSVCLRKKGRG